METDSVRGCVDDHFSLYSLEKLIEWKHGNREYLCVKQIKLSTR